jgi:hypothetical protein
MASVIVFAVPELAPLDELDELDEPPQAASDRASTMDVPRPQMERTLLKISSSSSGAYGMDVFWTCDYSHHARGLQLLSLFASA